MNLTKGPLDVVSEPDRPARETDAEGGIEITREMIEAGVLALDDTDYGRDHTVSAEATVMTVISAMLRVAGISLRTSL